MLVLLHKFLFKFVRSGHFDLFFNQIVSLPDLLAHFLYLMVLLMDLFRRQINIVFILNEKLLKHSFLLMRILIHMLQLVL